MDVSLQDRPPGAPLQARVPDEELMREIATGDLHAFDTLYGRYHQQIYNFVRKQINSPDSAEDLVQEIFLRVFRSAKGFDVEKKFSSWMYRIALNEIKRHWKRSTARQAYSLNAPIGDGAGDAERQDLLEDQHPGPAETFETETFSQELRQLIDRLPEKQKTVVLLKVYQELTFEQIAEICECPLSTVLSRMRYAVSKLRRWLGLEEGGDPYGL